MGKKFVRATVAGILLALGGCAFTDEALIPSLSGEPSPSEAAPATPAAPAATAPAGSGPQRLNTGTFVPEGVTPGQPTGTAVGQKIVALRGDLMQLQADVKSENDRLQALRAQAIQNASAYNSTVEAMSAKLGPDTTPKSPDLVAQLNQAQSQLAAVSADLAQMNTLSNDVTASATIASYLVTSTRAAFGILGAVDEDQRQLAVLKDEANRTTMLIDGLLTDLTKDIAQQTNYLGSGRNDLNTLAVAVDNGKLDTASFTSRQISSSPAGGTVPGVGVGSGRPFVLIRFARPDVNYEQALFSAVSAALDRRPDVSFDLVAVTPSTGNEQELALAREEARRDAERVLHSLTSMGLSRDRVAVSEMTSPSAQTNEVHLYVR